MEAFFARYPEFNYDKTASVIEEFNRLSESRKWSQTGRTRNNAFQAFRTAMIEEFNQMYGTDANDLAAWQKLCVFCGKEAPSSITQCRKVVKKIHVNLVDLIQHDSVPTIFPSLRALRNYTQQTGKYFPRRHAKQGGLLKHLLREVKGADHE
ncbi:hypothetical protein RUND412_003989 [Rhizina undulata]